MSKHLRVAFWAALALSAPLTVSVQPALADKISHPTAVFVGLDKITGRIISFDVARDETVQFGSLQITPKICYTRPLTEAPQTTTFIEVDDVGFGDKSELKRVFSGWMYAASPGLHGIEHPVYDIWLKNCKGEGELIKGPEEVAAAPPDDPTLRLPRAGAAPARRGADPLANPPGGILPPLPGEQRPVAQPPLLPPPQPVAQPRQPARSFFSTTAPIPSPAQRELGNPGGQ